LVDERENGSWSTVEIKKVVRKTTPSKKKSKKKILAIRLVTPKMVEEEKIEMGRASLMDKEGMHCRLTKTRMCNSAGSGKPCRHGPRCRYAHSVDELRVGACFFKDACRHVRRTATGYHNCRHRHCSFLHPGESMQSYCGRLGLEYTAQAKVQAEKPPVAKPRSIPMPRLSAGRTTVRTSNSPTSNVWDKRAVQREVVKPVEVKTKEGWTEVKRSERRTSSSMSRQSRGSSAKKPRSSSKRKEVICSSVGTGKPCRHGNSCRFRHVEEVRSRDQVVLRVPSSLAVQAMQHAMAAGIKNFRVVVV
jgi:hypothetical protein